MFIRPINPMHNVYYARGFNPLTGYLEDAATGVAAGALSCGLHRSIIVYQGGQINHPSKIKVIYTGNGYALVGGFSIIGSELTSNLTAISAFS